MLWSSGQRVLHLQVETRCIAAPRLARADMCVLVESFLVDSHRSAAILLFAGEQDLICNWLGISNMIDDLHWNGQKGFGVSRVSSFYDAC
jgi:hypothetical protein